MTDPKTYADFPPSQIWRMLPGSSAIVTVFQGRIWMRSGGSLVELVPKGATTPKDKP